MNKWMAAFCLLLTASTSFGSGLHRTELLYGLSLEASTLAVEDYKSEGIRAERLEVHRCSPAVSVNGDYCVVSKNNKGEPEALYGLSLATSSQVMEDLRSEGIEAERLSALQCSRAVNTSGEYCVIAFGK